MSQRELQVWVLAASTGGVAAVPKFLSLVPCAKHIAIIYVQHLVEEQHRHLINIVGRHCSWSVSGLNYGTKFRGGTVVIPSADERFDIGDDGVVGVTNKAGWKHPYSPNIDDVAEQVGQYYGASSGLIVFTGMGNDGARGSETIVACGGSVWVQTPETCAAVSMPQSVLSRVTPNVLGSIEHLAEQFNQQLAATSG